MVDGDEGWTRKYNDYVITSPRLAQEATSIDHTPTLIMQYPNHSLLYLQPLTLNALQLTFTHSRLDSTVSTTARHVTSHRTTTRTALQTDTHRITTFRLVQLSRIFCPTDQREVHPAPLLHVVGVSVYQPGDHRLDLVESQGPRARRLETRGRGE